MNIEQDTIGASLLHLSAIGKQGQALCGKKSAPTDLAITCWGRQDTILMPDKLFCKNCEAIRLSGSLPPA